MKTIVAAVDFSNATPAVVESAVSLAKACGADLELYHAVEPEPNLITYGFTPSEFPMLNAYREEIIRKSKSKMAELLAKVRADVPQATSKITEGNPLAELLDHVKTSGADFVVVGSHGHGVLGSLLLGSVAEGMVRKATVPTLVIPAAPE